MMDVQREQRWWRLAGRIAGVGVVMAMVAGCSPAVEGLLQARVSGNEASAIGSLRAIVSAQVVSSLDCNGRYKPSLTALGATGNLSPDLGTADTVEKSGYRLTIAPSGDGEPAAAGVTPACEGTVTGFTATAVPIEPGTTGQRFFITAQQGQVKQATSGTFADATPIQ